MKKYISYLITLVAIVIFQVGLAESQVLGLTHAQKANVNNSNPPALTFGFSAGDVDTFGVRYMATSSSYPVRWYGEITVPDFEVIDVDIAGGGGLYYEIANSGSFDLGIRAKAHTALDEFGDIYSFGIAGVIGNEIPEMQNFSWYAFAGFDYLKIDEVEVDTFFGDIEVNVDDSETEPALGAGLMYAVDNKWAGNVEISNSFDDTYFGINLSMNF